MLDEHRDLRFVTVVMPVRNEAGFIAKSLESVLRQDYPIDRFEVIVADGMSDDGTRAVIEVLTATSSRSPRVVVLDNYGRTAASGLNLAIANARGDVIVRVDGHCEIDRRHVSSCVRLLEQTGADNVGGIQIASGTTILQRAIAHGMSSPFGVGDARFHYASEPGWADTVFPGAWNREVFERVGSFDEELVRNQDDEHNQRIVQAGGKIWLDPAIRTRYTPRATLPSLWRQYFGYGLHKVRVIQKRRSVAATRHLVPAAFVSAVAVCGLVGVVTRRPKLVLIVVLPWAAASLAASWEAARADPVTLPMLPVVFATLHVSYGSGFLAGVWKWRHEFVGARARG